MSFLDEKVTATQATVISNYATSDFIVTKIILFGETWHTCGVKSISISHRLFYSVCLGIHVPFCVTHNVRGTDDIVISRPSPQLHRLADVHCALATPFRLQSITRAPTAAFSKLADSLIVRCCTLSNPFNAVVFSHQCTRKRIAPTDVMEIA